jgi:superfamily II DNA or RNA helicase
MILDPSQDDCLTRTEGRYRAGMNRPLIVAATGWGKTATFANIPSKFGFSGRGMVLTHREKLAHQTALSIQEWNPSIMVGTEMGQSRAGGLCNVVVGSVPTLGKASGYRLQRFPADEFDWVASDEAHHSMAPEWRRCLEHFGVASKDGDKRILSLGFTATPNRADGLGLAANFDEIVYEYPITKGIEDGILVDLVGVRIDTKTSLEGVGFRAGKFNDAELTKEINTDERNAIIVRAWAQHCGSLRTMVFTQNIQHALDLAAAFQAHGIGAKAVWGDDPDQEQTINAHKAGEFPVMLNCALTIEGYDDPEIRWVILATPDGSSVRYAQKIGRVTRIEKTVRRMFGNLHAARAAGHPIIKEWGGVMDICDNCDKHSLQTLPSLLGMPKDLDLKGKSVMKAKAEFERVAREFPTANLTNIHDLTDLDAISSHLELFKVSYPPEVSRLTELAWTKQGDAYVINAGRNRITIAADLLGEFWVRGRMNNTDVAIRSQNLAGAFNAADREILEGGGVKSILARESKWRNDGPSEKQIALCKKINLPIPNGATRGMVSAAMDAHFAARRA